MKLSHSLFRGKLGGWVNSCERGAKHYPGAHKREIQILLFYQGLSKTQTQKCYFSNKRVADHYYEGFHSIVSFIIIESTLSRSSLLVSLVCFFYCHFWFCGKRFQFTRVIVCLHWHLFVLFKLICSLTHCSLPIAA